MADQIIIEYGAKIDKLEAELKRLEDKLLSVEKTGKKSGDGLGDSFKKQGGIINELKGKIDDLTKARDKSHNPFMIKRYNQLIDENNSKLKELTTTTKNNSGVMTKAFTQVGTALAAAFAVERMIAFSKKVVEVRAEFQRLEAVLTNTLGSKSAAERSLNMIQDFAAKTPFGVKEITEEFVKLANRGIRPSQEQLTRMGDVAATLGKPLSQLNEAILDVSNTERWNELGIKVKANGDKMTGTFRGVTLEVARTEAGALKMIESFGQMEGVSGAMASISETLTGRISNLEDSFDKLFNTIGSRTDSVIGEAISMFGELVSNIADQMTSIDDLIKRDLSDNTTKFVEENRKSLRTYLEGVKKDGGDVQKALANDLAVQVQILTDSLNKVKADLNDFDEANKGGLFGSGFAEGVFKITDEAEKQRNAILVQKVLIEEQIKALGDLYQEEFKGLSKTTEEVVKFDKKAYNERLDTLKDLADFNRQVYDDLEKEEHDRLLREQENIKKQGEFRRNQLHDYLKEQEEIEKERTRIEEEEAKKREEIAKREAARKKEIQSALTNFIFDSIRTLADAAIERRNQELENELTQNRIESEEYSRKLEERNRNGKLSDEQLAKQREKIQKDLAKKEAEIKKQQFKADQDAALLRVAITTAEGVIRAIAQSPATFGLPFSAFVAASGLLQAGVIKSQKAPKFKDGVIDFKGSGTETSDSNVVMISNRESIIKARQSVKHKDALKAINDDYFEKYIDKYYVVPAMKKAEKNKQDQEKRKTDTAENIYRAMMQNGLVDLSHMERLTKRNKSVRMENVDELAKGIYNNLKQSRDQKSPHYKR